MFIKRMSLFNLVLTSPRIFCEKTIHGTIAHNFKWVEKPQSGTQIHGTDRSAEVQKSSVLFLLLAISIQFLCRFFKCLDCVLRILNFINRT